MLPTRLLLNGLLAFLLRLRAKSYCFVRNFLEITTKENKYIQQTIDKPN